MARRIRRLNREMFEAVLSAADKRFPPQNDEKVSAYAIARRYSGGRRLNYYTLQLRVERKYRRAGVTPTRIDFEYDGRSYELEPDILGVGAQPTTCVGDFPYFSGLHVGATIGVPRYHEQLEYAAIAAFADEYRNGVQTGNLFAITCGHVFEHNALGTYVHAGYHNGSPARVGVVVANLLDRSESPLDVAAIELDSTGLGIFDGTSPPFTAGAALGPNAYPGKLSVAYLPTVGDTSRPPVAAQEHLGRAHLWCATRGSEVTLDRPVVTEGLVTIGGDSGTALVTADAHRKSIGICSGGDRDTTWFEPLHRAVGQLENELDVELRVLEET